MHTTSIESSSTAQAFQAFHHDELVLRLSEIDKALAEGWPLQFSTKGKHAFQTP